MKIRIIYLVCVCVCLAAGSGQLTVTAGCDLLGVLVWAEPFTGLVSVCIRERERERDVRLPGCKPSNSNTRSREQCSEDRESLQSRNERKEVRWEG